MASGGRGGGGGGGGGGKQKGVSRGKKGSSYQFGSDGTRVLDKGVWKRFKYCSWCSLIMVERAKWQDCWDDVKYCSDRCRSEAKRAAKQQQAAPGEPGAPAAADTDTGPP